MTTIVDGDTFDVRVTHTGNQNKYQYSNVERIRIAEMDAPELSSLLGQRSKNYLQQKLLNKEVKCHVQARDEYGRIVAKVQMLTPVYQY